MRITKRRYLDLNLKSFDNIIDVRSPSEFKEDHIPTAVNLPVLSDDERAIVGKTYKQDSRFTARKLGATLITKNIAKHLANPIFDKGKDWSPVIYCWRGGQRSLSFATILSEIGWRPTLIEGGYKNYRSTVNTYFSKKSIKFNLILISGHTGTGKTKLLESLKELGLQTVNLEDLANHRGSVFGAISNPQPSQKLFETLLYDTLIAFDNSKPLLLEAESRKIGKLVIPEMLWNQMKYAKRIEIRAPLRERARYLIKEYKDLTQDSEKLNRRLRYLLRQQGHTKIEKWIDLSNKSKYLELAKELMINHYDPRYENSRTKYSYQLIGSMEFRQITNLEMSSNAKKIKLLI